MGFKSPVCESVKIMKIKINQILDYGNCEIARFRGKEAYVKSVSPRTGRFYKAGMADELAQHSKVLDSAMKVKNRVVQKQFTCLPREALSRRFRGFQSTQTTEAPIPAMGWARRDKESAKSILVVSESVSNRRRVTRPVKSAASGCGRRLEPKKRKQPEVGCE